MDFNDFNYITKSSNQLFTMIGAEHWNHQSQGFIDELRAPPRQIWRLCQTKSASFFSIKTKPCVKRCESCLLVTFKLAHIEYSFEQENYVKGFQGGHECCMWNADSCAGKLYNDLLAWGIHWTILLNVLSLSWWPFSVSLQLIFV